jgi:hypothetical protein
MSLFDVSEQPKGLHKRAIARQELRNYPIGAPTCVQPAKKGERGLK